MIFEHRAIRPLWPALLAAGAACAQQPPADPALVRTDGLYRSEVQTNEEGSSYISVLRFAPDGRVFLTHVSMPARQERVCQWFKPELQREFWSQASSYRAEGGRLSFQTVSPSATTLFDGTADSGVLRMQLVVPTNRNLRYSLRFDFEPCP